MIVVYIFLLALVWYLTLRMSKGDWFDVMVLLLSGYMISAVCCLYNISLWDVKIHLYTVFVLFTGFISVGIGTAFGNRLQIRKKSELKRNSIYEITVKGVSTTKILIVIIFSIIVTVLLINEIGSIANLNQRVWASMIINYRRNLSDASINAEHSLFVDLGLRVTRAFAYIYLTVFISALNYKKQSHKFIWLYIIPAILYGIQCLVRGVRIPIISLIIAAVFEAYFFYKYNRNWYAHINIKKIGKLLIAGIVVCVVFYYAKFFIGKLQDSDGVLAYVTNYLGGSLQLFDMYLFDPTFPDGAHETFAGFVNSLKSFGFFQGVETVVQHEYRNASTGVYIGNVYTGFRNYYNDFGLMGLIYISFLFGLIFSMWYKSLKRYKYWNTTRLFSLILYSYLIYCVAFHFFTDYFFSLIAVGWVVNIIIMYILCWFVFGKSEKKH